MRAISNHNIICILSVLTTAALVSCSCQLFRHQSRKDADSNPDSLYNSGQYQQAYNLYLQQQKKKKSGPFHDYRMAVSAFKIRRYRTSAYYFEKYLLNGTDARKKQAAAVKILLCRFRLEQLEKLNYLLKKYKKKYNLEQYPGLNYLQGEIAFKNKNYTQARANYLRYIEQDEAKFRNQALLKLTAIYTEIMAMPSLAARYFHSINTNHLNSAEQDRCLWLYKKLGYKIISKKDGLTGNAVSSLLFDGDDLWIGTWLNGLNRYNLSLNEITPYKALKNNFIANTVRDIKLQDRFIWIATFDGLTRFNINTEKYKDFSGIFYDPDEINKSNPRIKALEIDNNRLYIASLGKGLRIFYTTANKWEVFRRSTGFFDNYLTCLALYDNKLFVGSMRRGAAVVDIKNKNYTVINNAYQYTGRNIRDLYADTDYIIIATKNYGLYILDHNYKILAHINMDNYPIMSNYFTSIERKGNMIYCGTMGGGLIIINQRGFTVKTKTVINGLASDSIMSVKYKRGFVWLGTVDKGVIRCLVRN